MKETDRIKEVYSKYLSSNIFNDLYGSFGINTYHNYVFEKELLKYFFSRNIPEFNRKKVLDVGTGAAEILFFFLKHGITLKNIFGLELLLLRAEKVKKKYGFFQFLNANGENIPFADKCMDIITLTYVFSSIIEDKMCYNIGKEMLRVIKDDGIIIWYDSYGGKKLSENTRSYKENDIKQFFPDCEYEFKRIGLGKIFNKRIEKYSWLIADVVSAIFPFLNCMQLCIIKKRK